MWYTHIGIWDFYNFSEKDLAIYSNFRDTHKVQLEILHLDMNFQKNLMCIREYRQFGTLEHYNAENLSIDLNVSQSVLMNIYIILECHRQIKVHGLYLHLT